MTVSTHGFGTAGQGSYAFRFSFFSSFFSSSFFLLLSSSSSLFFIFYFCDETLTAWYFIIGKRYNSARAIADRGQLLSLLLVLAKPGSRTGRPYGKTKDSSVSIFFYSSGWQRTWRISSYLFEPFCFVTGRIVREKKQKWRTTGNEPLALLWLCRWGYAEFAYISTAAISATSSHVRLPVHVLPYIRSIRVQSTSCCSTLDHTVCNRESYCTTPQYARMRMVGSWIAVARGSRES